jgi:transposase
MSKNTKTEERKLLVMRIKELRSAGNTIDSVAQILQLSSKTIWRWIGEHEREQKLKERTKLLEQIKELRAAGNSISRTAQIMDMTRGTVQRWIMEEQPDRVVKKMDPYVSIDEKTAIVVKWAELIASGETRSNAAASVGFPTMMLNRWLMSEPSLRIEFQESVGKKQNNWGGRKSFEQILVDVRAGRPVWRDGGRFKLQLVESALMRYELDGANVWRCKGFATLSGTDVLARDWLVMTNEV